MRLCPVPVDQISRHFLKTPWKIEIARNDIDSGIFDVLWYLQPRWSFDLEGIVGESSLDGD